MTDRSPASRDMLRRSLAVAACCAALTLSGIAGGCGKKADAKQSGTQSVAVDVAAARTDSVQRSVEVIGTLFGEEDTTISNKVNGRIIAIYKDVGDRVSPGEPLAQLLRNDYLLDLNQKRAALLEVLAKLGLSDMPPATFDLTLLPSVRQAKLQVQNAEAKYNRGQQLHAQVPPLLSDQDFEDLRTALEVARSAYDAQVLAARGLLGEAGAKHAELLQAEQAVKDTTVRAPRAQYAVPQLSKPISAVDQGLMEDTEAGPTTLPAVPPGPNLGPDGLLTTQPAARPAAAPTTAPTVASGTGPHSYVIAARYGNEGELAKAITPLFRLVDDDPLKLRAAVPERFFPEIALKQVVKITVAAYPNTTFTGVITRINPQVDQANRTFPVEIVVPNPDHKLSPGGFANAAIRTRMEEGVVFVPASAVVTFAGVDKVYVIEDGKAKEVIVTLGDRRGNEIEIRKGLTGKEKVATSGTSRLATGVAVTVKGPTTAPAAK